MGPRERARARARARRAGHREEIIKEGHAKALDDATLAVAVEIAGNAPLSVRGNKRVLRTT